MNVREITIEYLKRNEYDGLFNAIGECGCSLDDFAPCGGIEDRCEPGYVNNCTTCAACEECAYQGDYDFMVRNHHCFVSK